MPKKYSEVRSSLNELQLSKQRSNSEAHLHVLSSSLKPIREAESRDSPEKEAKSVLRTPSQPASKLKQPTRFGDIVREKVASLSRRSSMENQVANLNKEKSAPHMV